MNLKDTMKLTIIAATGGVGRQVLRQALDAGHDVTAVARNPAKLPADILAAGAARVITADLAGSALVTGGLLLGLAPRGRPTPHARTLPATPPAPAARYVDTGTGHNQQRGAVPFSIGLTATSLTGEKAQASRQARRQPGGRDHGLRLRAGLHKPADGGESPVSGVLEGWSRPLG